MRHVQQIMHVHIWFCETDKQVIGHLKIDTTKGKLYGIYFDFSTC